MTFYVPHTVYIYTSINLSFKFNLRKDLHARFSKVFIEEVNLNPIFQTQDVRTAEYFKFLLVILIISQYLGNGSLFRLCGQQGKHTSSSKMFTQ